MTNKPTPEQIAGINRYLKEPFPEEFDEWTPGDFERFLEIVDEVMKTTFQEWVGIPVRTLVKIRPSVIAMIELCTELYLKAGFTWDGEKGEWIPSEQ